MKRLILFFVGMSLLVSCELDTTIRNEITSDYLLNGTLDVYLQNNQVFRYKGKPGIVTIPIGNPDLAKYESCFVLHVATGVTQATKVSSAIVKLDGLEVLNTSDFSKNSGQYMFEICNLTPTSALTVEVRGEPGSYLDVWIEGKLSPEINEFYDLNDNQVPLGWELVVLNPDVVLESGKLFAFTVDAQGSLRRYVNIPTSITKMECEWDGNLAYTYWGMTNHLQFILDDNSTLEVYLQTAGAWGINNNKLILQYYSGIYGDSNYLQNLFLGLVPIKYGDFHYKVILDNNQIRFTCNDIADNTSYVDQIINIPNSMSFNLQRIKSVNYTVNTTTDNNNWMDNIVFRLTR